MLIPCRIDGKALAVSLLGAVKKKVSGFDHELCLGIIQVGSDPASDLYISYKIKRARSVGISIRHIQLPVSVPESGLLKQIQDLNIDSGITGFFIQAPLPKHLNFKLLTANISEYKDVDGLNPNSLGKLYSNNTKFMVSATGLAVLRALKSIDVSLAGKHAVIIGRSIVVGKPVAALLLNENSTVTICHSETQNLSKISRTADILVSCTGKSGLIDDSYVQKGAILIDCGSPNPEFTQQALYKSSYYTPVPGGIGPLTISCLLENCTKAYEWQHNL